ncbi:hypothetical protein B4Q13_15090 [Lacticaseibacillus rhamnosus]
MLTDRVDAALIDADGSLSEDPAVLYGPFSAIYPGHSVGAVVDYVTRMPKQLEAHAKAGYVSQPFELYGHSATYRAWQTRASLGSRSGDWAWWINVNHTDSEGQPLTFPNRLLSNGTASSTGTSVTGAVSEPNSANKPWYLIGAQPVIQIEKHCRTFPCVGGHCFFPL